MKTPSVSTLLEKPPPRQKNIPVCVSVRHLGILQSRTDTTHHPRHNMYRIGRSTVIGSVLAARQPRQSVERGVEIALP
jgi:hypothetical protein